MAIQIGGAAQTAQQERELDLLQGQADRFARAVRNVLREYEELARIYSATGYGADLGAAAADEYVTESADSRDVGSLRSVLKAAVSHAVNVGMLTQSEGDALLQQVYGNETETTVDAAQIDALADQWV